MSPAQLPRISMVSKMPCPSSAHIVEAGLMCRTPQMQFQLSWNAMNEQCTELLNREHQGQSWGQGRLPQAVELINLVPSGPSACTLFTALTIFLSVSTIAHEQHKVWTVPYSCLDFMSEETWVASYRQSIDLSWIDLYDHHHYSCSPKWPPLLEKCGSIQVSTDPVWWTYTITTSVAKGRKQPFADDKRGGGSWGTQTASLECSFVFSTLSSSC